MLTKDKKFQGLLSIEEVAGMLHCHKNTLRNWDKIGLLRAVRIGPRGDRRYKKDDVLKIMQSQMPE